MFALIPFALFAILYFVLGLTASGSGFFIKLSDFGRGLARIVFFRTIEFPGYTDMPPAEFWLAPYIASLVLLLAIFVPVHTIFRVKSDKRKAKVSKERDEAAKAQAETEAKAIAELYNKAYQYANGDRYYGDWENGAVGGVKDGRGTYWYADGRRYEGGFSGDKKSGAGKAYSRDGKLLYSGTFAGDNCRYNSSETVYFRTHPLYGDDLSWIDYIEYQGQYLNGVKHGAGQWIFHYTQKGDSNRTFLIPKKKSYSEYCQYINGQIDQNWAAQMQSQEQSRMNAASDHWWYGR